MNPVSAFVLFAVIWWLVFFIVLPLRLVTQGEAGRVEPGTSSSAPANFQFRRKARLTTIWAALVWAVVAGVIMSGAISVRDLDLFNQMSPAGVDGG
jgi:predicted secreted protein